MKKRCLVPLIAAVFFLSAAGFNPAFGQPWNEDAGQNPPRTVEELFGPRKLWERVEISLTGGVGIPFMKWTTLHFSQFQAAAGFRVTAENRIKTTAAPAVYAGAAVTFFRRGPTGIQAGFGYLKSGLASHAHFELRATGGPLSAYTSDETGTGELTSVPVFVCLYNPFEVLLGKKRLRAFMSVGPAVFFNSVLTGTRGGAAAIRGEAVDGLIIPVAVADSTWIAFGMTGGLGLDFPVTKSLAFGLEARYFYAPRKSFVWTWTPGNYDGVLRNVSGYAFDGSAASDYAGDTTPLTINPAFLQIAGGIKFVF